MKTLAEKHFEEAFGFTTAGKVGRGLGSLKSKEFKTAMTRAQRMAQQKAEKGVPLDKRVLANDPEFMSNIKASQKSKQAVTGKRIAQGSLGAVYAGGAYITYKLIKKLRKKLKGETSPEKIKALKKKIAIEKQKIKKKS